MKTDLVMLALAFFFVLRGMSKGLLRSILSPLSFIGALLIAWIVHSSTGNKIQSLLVAIGAQIILFWGLKFFLGKKPDQMSLIDRAAGGFLGLLWGMFITLLILAVVPFIPPITPAITTIRTDVLSSRSFAMTKLLTAGFGFPVQTDQSPSKEAPPDPALSLQALAQDPRMTALREDPDFLKAVEDKNYAALMSNPKILAIAQDPEMIKKLMAVYNSGALTQPKEIPPPSEPLE